MKSIIEGIERIKIRGFLVDIVDQCSDLKQKGYVVEKVKTTFIWYRFKYWYKVTMRIDLLIDLNNYVMTKVPKNIDI